jgi:hypothetical protein
MKAICMESIFGFKIGNQLESLVNNTTNIPRPHPSTGGGFVPPLGGRWNAQGRQFSFRTANGLII